MLALVVLGKTGLPGMSFGNEKLKYLERKDQNEIFQHFFICLVQHIPFPILAKPFKSFMLSQTAFCLRKGI